MHHREKGPAPLGTYKTVKARFWPWLSGKRLQLSPLCVRVEGFLPEVVDGGLEVDLLGELEAAELPFLRVGG